MQGEAVRGGFPDPGFGSLSGLERGRAYVHWLAPRPPISHLIGLRASQVGPGSATVTMPASPWLVDTGDSIQPVVLMETACHAAALTAAPAGMDVSTTTLSVNYLRPANVDSGTFVARARIVHSGRTYTLTEAHVEDAAGRAVAQGSASLITRPIEPAPPPLPSGLQPMPQVVYPTPDPYLRSPPAFAGSPPDGEEWLAAFRELITGASPSPPMQLFDSRLAAVDRGQMTTVLRTSEWACWSGRVVAPGVIAYIGLLAMHGAAATLSPSGSSPAILNMTFSFLRGVLPDGRELVAQGTVTHSSGDLFVSQMEVTDADGNRVAVGQETAVARPTRRRAGDGEPRRELLTVLFTDIVGSTERAEALGDAAWREVLAEHDAVLQKQADLFKGTVVKRTGDGALVTFDSPARAIHCARAVRSGLVRLGLEMRAGLHTGECELVGSDVAGIAVHVAARLLALADPGDLLVSATVPDLVAGSGIQFHDRGLHELKGIEGKRQVFAVVG
ncbi:MAG TPA: hotdog fold thioesterase [Acidimicrobiia bacterium]